MAFSLFFSGDAERIYPSTMLSRDDEEVASSAEFWSVNDSTHGFKKPLS
jgi:hypothetical protein